MQDTDHRTASASYAPEPAAAAQARHFIRETLRSWDVRGSASQPSGLVDDAVLLTSELVTNAVMHAGTQILLTCRVDGTAVEVTVRDKHPARPLTTLPPAAGDPADLVGGRGLMLPSTLATAWGVTYARSGKAVWFRLSLDDYRADATEASDPPAVGLLTLDDAGSAAKPPITNGAAGQVAGEPAEAEAEPLPARPDLGKLGYEELLRHTVELARDAVDADAAYALVADEDGELRMRAAAGLGSPAVLDVLTGRAGPADGSASRSVMTVPFLVEGRVTGILAAASAEPNRFGQADSARLQRVADRMALSLERSRLVELERVRRGRISFLAEASDLLAGTLDQEKIIALAAQLVVPRLAAWCAVLLEGEDGRLHPAYVWHADETMLDALGQLIGILPVPEVPARGGGRSWSLALDDPDGLPADVVELASGSAWGFPLEARGRSLGVLTIGGPRGGSLSREVSGLAEDLARRTALALDNARLYERQQETSQALQRSLLPPDVPEIPGLDLAVVYEAAGEGNEVGGDFYDVFAVGEGRWRFTIGDVCGTGPAAAAVTGLARNSLRILAAEGYGIAAVLGRLNRLLLDGGAGRFITLIHGEICPGTAENGDPSGARLSLVCAGHPPPLLLRAPAGGADTPAAVPAVKPQTLLGVIDDLTFEVQDVLLAPGDLILCVTDGVTERRDGGRQLDEDDGLARWLSGCTGLSAGAVAARVQRLVSEFGAVPATDDMALLVLRAM